MPPPPLPTEFNTKQYSLSEAQKADDCLSCRVVGGGAFITLGVVSYFTGQRGITENAAKIRASKSVLGIVARRRGITGMAAVFVGLGVYRLFG
ncbi:hypothetical protein K402DRAFT_326066 [Aulographum hederae CBS 113979]|uniref:DUF4536 domain-containing protein n=1 Tax=Aulographum hederae CBS 113979 TaxID=1176131 RepID=A0A6G1H9S1_9PEZI|nr:hypothetical protein K402DRAFT_326066 [Aulographum hederae CBS 113979]